MRMKNNEIHDYLYVQGAKLLSFRVSGTPKNTAGNPIFLQGFPTGHPVKIKARLSERFFASLRKA